MPINFRKFLFFSAFIIMISISSFSFIYATSESKIDPKIYETLNSGKEGDRVFISLNNIDNSRDFINSFDSSELKVIRVSKRFIVADITSGGLAKSARDSRVLSVQEDIVVSANLHQTAPLINATGAWNILNATGKGVKVCVIDSGVNVSHPSLQGKIAGQHCFCNQVEGNFSYCCPGGSSEANTAPDNNGHGTHVVGIIASQDSTYRGIAFNSSIYVVKTLNSSGKGYITDISDSIDWCESQGAKVVSISIGDSGNYTVSSCPTYINPAINSAYNKNISVFIASGNEGYSSGMNYPACSPKAISVGATTKSDGIAFYTNKPSYLALLAPGDSVVSLRWNSQQNLGSCNPAGTNFMQCSGTSMATPHAAATAALLLEKDSTLTPDKIKKILNETGKKIVNWNRIDAAKAVASLCVCTAYAPGSCGGSCLGSERQYTRTCNPTGCAAQVQCVHDSSCTAGGGGVDRIVCKTGGCTYTTIQSAINASGIHDTIIVNDSSIYNERVIFYSNRGADLECINGAKIKGTNGLGIFTNRVDGPIVKGCTIEGFFRGIYINSSHGQFFNNTIIDNSRGFFIEKNSNDNRIYDNFINDSADYGLTLTSNVWSDGPIANDIKRNTFVDNGDKSIWFNFGIQNSISYNNISGNTLGSFGAGIHIQSAQRTSFTSMEGNKIHRNVEGIYLQSTLEITIENNTLCDSNTNHDIFLSGTNSFLHGGNNRCENAHTWNDVGTTGCAYYCDTAPSVTLVEPLDQSNDTDGNVFFSCIAEDNYNVANISLYHNISGTWALNQTRTVTGSYATAVFNIPNLPNALSFDWNCRAFDNHSRSSFGPDNWTTNIVIQPSDINILNLRLVYSNQTTRVFSFLINNTLNQPIGSISWNLITGENNIISGQLFNLSNYEDAAVFAAYNYTASGQYLVTANAYAGNSSDSKSIIIEV